MTTLLLLQTYAGYVLHTCVLTDDEDEDKSARSAAALLRLQAGAEVEAQVNYDRRRRVAPNHTMSHALNNALRKVSILLTFSGVL